MPKMPVEWANTTMRRYGRLRSLAESELRDWQRPEHSLSCIMRATTGRPAANAWRRYFALRDWNDQNTAEQTWPVLPDDLIARCRSVYACWHLSIRSCCTTSYTSSGCTSSASLQCIIFFSNIGFHAQKLLRRPVAAVYADCLNQL